MSAAYIVSHSELVQMALAAGITYGGVGFLIGYAVGKSVMREHLDKLMAEARRWRFWRRHHFHLASYQCARAAGLDLSRIYVNTPDRLDQVTDAAIAAQAFPTTEEPTK